MWSWGSYHSSQSRYSVLAEKSKLSFPLWGAVSPNTYTDSVPLMVKRANFTPSNRVLFSIKTEPVQRQSWIKLTLFQNLRAANDIKKRLKVVWCGNIWILAHRAPADGRSWAISFVSWYDKLWKWWVDEVSLLLMHAKVKTTDRLNVLLVRWVVVVVQGGGNWNRWLCRRECVPGIRWTPKST